MCEVSCSSETQVGRSNTEHKKVSDDLVSCFESHNNDNDFFILFKPLTHCKKVCLILLGLMPCIILKLYRYCTVVVSEV